MELKKQHLSDRGMFRKIHVSGAEAHYRINAGNHVVVKNATENF